MHCIDETNELYVKDGKDIKQLYEQLSSGSADKSKLKESIMIDLIARELEFALFIAMRGAIDDDVHILYRSRLQYALYCLNHVLQVQFLICS